MKQKYLPAQCGTWVVDNIFLLTLDQYLWKYFVINLNDYANRLKLKSRLRLIFRLLKISYL